MNAMKTTHALRKAAGFWLILFLVGLSMATAFPAAAGYDPGASQSKAPKVPIFGTGNTIVVNMTNGLRFKPGEIKIKVGDTVEWRNVGSIPHTVTADSGLAAMAKNVELPAGVKAYDSGWIRGNQSFRYTFTKPGVYRYVCLPHERAKMLGSVIVG